MIYEFYAAALVSIAHFAPLFSKAVFSGNIVSGIETQIYYIIIFKSYEIIRKRFNDTSLIIPCRSKFEIVI